MGCASCCSGQRPAKLHKDALTQVETLVSFRLIAPQDRNAIREWVREWADEATGAEMMASLPSLPTGTAWVWAPELDLLQKGTFPQIVTYDSGKPLAAGRKGPALKPIDLADVRGKLETVAKEAIESDPRRLKARIAELQHNLQRAEQALAKMPVVGTSKADLDAADNAGHQRGHAEGYHTGYLEGMTEFVKLIRPVVERGNALIAIGAELAEELQKIAPALAAPAPPAMRIEIPAAPATAARGAPVAQRIERPAPDDRKAAGSSPAGRTSDAISPAQQRLLDALAEYEAIGYASVTRAQLGFWVSLRAGTGNFGNYLGSLRSLEMIDYPQPGLVAATPILFIDHA